VRLIFLDIDGVLNDSYHSEPLILPQCAEQFNRIVRATGANVVVSSSWRCWIHGGLMTELGFQRLLRTHGIACSIVGVTPPDGRVQGRDRQITAWLVSHGPVTAYVVLDDDQVQGHPLIRTDGTRGLTEQDADRAICLLTEV
jgi:HAD domain in Swiss Army Knife RNA repair proteins